MKELVKGTSIGILLAFFFTALPASSSYAFTLMSNAGRPAYWPHGDVHYRFNTATNGYFSGGHDHSGTATDEFTPIRTAFAAWSNLPGVALNIVENSTTSSGPSTGDGSNTIKWIRTGWRNLSFRPPSNALAVTLLSFSSSTGYIVDADIYFNAENFQWAVVDNASESGYIDVENIATHEIGHVLGLDHSSENIFETDALLADATMFYASSMGETARRDPHEDDINGILNLYGAASRSTPSLSTLETVSNTSSTIQYRITGTGFDENTEFVLTRNDGAYSDCVSRYRTILSSSEALVTFDISTFVNGTATLIAFNDPTHLATFNAEVSGAGYAATSTGGGGGCTITTESVFDLSFGFVLLAAALSILGLRRQVKLRA